MKFRELCAECHQGRDTNRVRDRRLGRAGSGEACGAHPQLDPLVKEPGQADIREPVPASRVPFYLRDTRGWTLAPVPPGSVVMLARDSPSGAMKRPKVGPPTTVRLPVQSALTE